MPEREEGEVRGILSIKLLAPLAASACLAAMPSPAAAGTGPYERVELGTFSQPTYADNAPGFPDLLFVTEQQGMVRVLRDEVLVERPFLDLTGIVRDGGEEGLLSIAFPPDYEASRRFYVYFTNDDGDIEVDEFRRKRRNPLRARRRSRREVIVIAHPVFGNHNGGTVRVDAARRLWLATGDGGGGGDPDDNARDLGSLLGKLIRLDPIPADRDAPGYRVPRSNPYVGVAGRNEIFSYGLRNPFRFEVDSRLGAISIGDVGQGNREEIDFVPRAVARGGNFGWPEREGDLPFDPTRPGAGEPIEPMFTYENPPLTPAAVTGGLVVRDPGLPGLAGKYLFADVYYEYPTAFTPDVQTNTYTGASSLTTLSAPYSVAFTEGAGRQLYITSLAGSVWRLEQGGAR